LKSPAARISILHLITELDTGGAQKALARLLARLDRERFAPHVACLYNGDRAVAQEIRQLGIPVTDLGMTAQWRLDALWRLYRLLRREQPVILHAWMFHANLLARTVGRLAGVPLILTSRRNVHIGPPVREHLKRLTASWDTRSIAVCELARQVEIERAGAAPDNVIVICNGIDAGRFPILTPEARTTARRHLGVPADVPVLGAVGRLHPQKGLPDLLSAFQVLKSPRPKAHLLIVGDGECRVDLGRQVQQRHLAGAVTFTGQRDDVPQLLALMDVFVLASHWEGLPNVVLEAMAAGLPVVATTVGGTPEVVVDGVTGFLVPPRDPEALADAILRLLRDPDLRRRMGEAGRARVAEHFSVEQMVGKTEALYEQLLKEEGLA
jgi:glycosyltransferase involved in cell wall biosynthesis